MSDTCTRTPIQLCPVCGAALDEVRCVTDQSAAPKPGDFTLCFYCCAVLRFDEKLYASPVPQDQVPGNVAEAQDQLEAYRLTLKGRRS